MTDLVKNQVSIFATATRQLENDVLTVAFQAQETGTDPNAVQEALRKRVSDALALIRPLVKGEEVEVETDSFSVYPTYKKNVISGYSGGTSLRVFGTDTATIADLASKVTTMTVAGTSNSVSRARRREVETDLLVEAITNFKDRAGVVAKAFGFAEEAWTIAAVNAGVDRGYNPKGGARIMAASAALESTPMEIESGKTEINATVQGSIYLGA